MYYRFCRNITNLKDNPELLKEVCLRVIQVLKTDVLKGEVLNFTLTFRILKTESFDEL